MGAISKRVRQTVRKLGIDIRRIDRAALSEDREYDLVIPRATYSPWNKDRLFKELYTIVRDSTLVDEYRCFELWKLVEQSSKLGAGHLIEIGVWRGGTGALIARQAANSGIPGLVYLCDTFCGVVKAGTHDSDYKGGEHSDTSRASVEELIKGLKLDNVRILQGIFPDESASPIADLQFRFCHIDVDVYQSAKEILDWIWGRLVPGGMIVYDDYGFKCCDGIAKHVEEQMAARDRLVLHNLNGHGVIVKL
jgi:O-methyltransferase